MRPVREITAKEEKFRLENMPEFPANISFIRRDPVEPEPVGTIVLLAFRVTGYDKDCDGSLMTRLAQIDFVEMDTTGWETDCHGLYPSTEIVVSEDELKSLYKNALTGSNTASTGQWDSPVAGK